MRKNRNDLRLLILQNRDHEFVRKDEHRVFALHSGLDISQITVLNAFDTPQYPLEILYEYDGLLVGGASEVSVNAIEKHPFLEREKELLLFAAEKNVPTFCSCFGFQLAIQAFGGTILKEKETCEMASIPISLTESAKRDVLFAGVPDGFLATSVHQEKAMSSCLKLTKNIEYEYFEIIIFVSQPPTFNMLSGLKLFR
jgi:GMP synthase (glutamine-hydrolysing)